MAVATAPERSVDWLQKLYAVVIGLALTEGLKNAVTAANLALPAASMMDKALRQETWPIVALIITIVPFFHGANRHLDDVYIFRRCGAKDFALLIDFFLLFLEGTIFYWLALVISKPLHFFNVYAVLLILDIAWAVAVFFYTETGWQNVWKWALTNLIAVISVGIVMATPLLGQDSRVHALGIIAVLRTIFDYIFNWRTFYPLDAPSIAPAAGAAKG